MRLRIRDLAATATFLALVATVLIGLSAQVQAGLPTAVVIALDLTVVDEAGDPQPHAQVGVRGSGGEFFVLQTDRQGRVRSDLRLSAETTRVTIGVRTRHGAWGARRFELATASSALTCTIVVAPHGGSGSPGPPEELELFLGK